MALKICGWKFRLSPRCQWPKPNQGIDLDLLVVHDAIADLGSEDRSPSAFS